MVSSNYTNITYNSPTRETATSLTTTSNYGRPCAACKYQRRSCPKDCPLAPYFPAKNQRDFLNVHRLYGVNNVVKFLSSVPPFLRPDLVTSLVYSADARSRDPVGGCYRILQVLKARVAQAEAELHATLEQLRFYRQLHCSTTTASTRYGNVYY